MPDTEMLGMLSGRPAPRRLGVAGAESQVLMEWLDWHRRRLVYRCHGADATEFTSRRVEPSGLTLHGLLRHMTDVERWWFQTVFAGRTWAGCDNGGDIEGPHIDLSDGDVAMAVCAFEAACGESRRITGGARLDDVAAHPEVRLELRWVMIHVIEEYARHQGAPPDEGGAAPTTACG